MPVGYGLYFTEIYKPKCNSNESGSSYNTNNHDDDDDNNNNNNNNNNNSNNNNNLLNLFGHHFGHTSYLQKG